MTLLGGDWPYLESDSWNLVLGSISCSWAAPVTFFPQSNALSHCGKKTRELDFYERKFTKYVFLFEAVHSKYLSQLAYMGE